MSHTVSVPRYLYPNQVDSKPQPEDTQNYEFCSSFLTDFCGRDINIYVIKVIGRALEPDLMPGTLILVRDDIRDIEHSTVGDLWVVEDDGELVIARCIFSGLDIKYLTSRNIELDSPKVFGRAMMTLARV